MIAIIDACAFLNILQTVGDETYFDWLDAEFTRVLVTEKAQQEIRQNKYENLVESDGKRLDHLRQQIDTIVHRRAAKYQSTEDASVCEDFLRTATGYSKRNGEFYSVALALYLSRMGGTDWNDHLLSVVFITDDERAADDFSRFYEMNQIGRLIDTIDVAILFYLRDRITRSDLSKFCLSLKALYSRQLAQTRNTIEAIRSELRDASELNCLSETLEVVMSGDHAKFTTITRNKYYTSLKRRYKSQFEEIESYMKAEEGNRVGLIENRRNQLECLWKL